EAPLRGNRTTSEPAPGILHVRRNIVEADGSVSDRQDSTVEVPDFAGTPLAITARAVFRASTPLQLRAIQAEPDPTPFAGRQFERTDRLIIRFAVAGAGSADTTVQAPRTHTRRAATLT